MSDDTRRAPPATVGLPELEGANLVGYVCDAIGRKQARFAGDDDAAMRLALEKVNFDTMPPGWFLIVRKAPKA